MMNSIKAFAIAAISALAALAAPAHAVTVDATQSHVWRFDLTTQGDLNFGEFGYSCYNATDDCGRTAGSGRLAPGASMMLSFGTSRGGSELGTALFTNPFATGVNNMLAGLGGGVFVAGAINTLYLTVSFVDDAFGVEATRLISLLGGTNVVRGEYNGRILTPVPLPASLPLLAGAIGLLGFRAAKRRRG